VVAIKQSANGAARAAQEVLVGIIQLFHRNLGFPQAAESFAHAKRMGLRRCGSGIECRAKMRGALGLQLVDVGIERPNLAAQLLLIGDAGFETVEVEGDNVSASGNQRGGQGTEEGDAALE